MPWTPAIAPLGSIGLSALVAAVPLAVLFGLLAWGRLPGWLSAVAAAAAAFVVTAAVWGMPAGAAASAGVQGAATGLFPIIWIVVSALWVHSLAVASGQFEVIRRTLASITTDRRLQALFIAFAFGAFLEGAAGFGTPVAISAAMLVGLGFEARAAAVLCLVANSSPVAFAAAGIPVAVAAGVSGIDVVTLGRIIGHQVPLLSFIVPFWLTVVLCGWRRTMEVLPALLVAGILMALTQLLISQFSGPWTAGILSGIVTLAGLWLFLKIWKPRSTWDFPGRIQASGPEAARATGARAPHQKVSALATLRAWLPYLLMSVLVLLWSLGPLVPLLRHGDIRFPWPGLAGREVHPASRVDSGHRHFCRCRCVGVHPARRRASQGSGVPGADHPQPRGNDRHGLPGPRDRVHDERVGNERDARGRACRHRRALPAVLPVSRLAGGAGHRFGHVVERPVRHHCSGRRPNAWGWIRRSW